MGTHGHEGPHSQERCLAGESQIGLSPRSEGRETCLPRESQTMAVQDCENLSSAGD